MHVDFEGGSYLAGSICVWLEIVSMIRRGRKYGEVEAVSADDLMRVRRRVGTWCDERIRTLDSKLRAPEAQHVLRRGRLREQRARSKSVPEHVV